jgi:hypothetical protein
MRGTAKHVRRDAAHRHRLARAETGDSEGSDAEKSLADAPHKASRKVLRKAKVSVRIHSKLAAKGGMRAHPAAKATVYASKAREKKPEKHARR